MALTSFFYRWWPYLDKMIFWNVSILTVLILALIELLRILWCLKHGRLTHRGFLSGRNTWQVMEIWVFQIKPKMSMVALATHMTVDWWNWIFLNGKYREKSHKAVTPNSKPVWRYVVISVRGAQNAPLAWIGITGDFVCEPTGKGICS